MIVKPPASQEKEFIASKNSKFLEGQKSTILQDQNKNNKSPDKLDKEHIQSSLSKNNFVL